MRASRITVRARSSGFTIVELILATALLTVLLLAVFALIDGSLRLWRKSETRRNLTEQATGVLELLAHDFRSLQGGERGDLLVEYATFDTDGDGLRETIWPRIRLVRQASEAEINRLALSAPPAVAELAEELLNEEEDPEAPPEGGTFDPDEAAGPALIEVCWAIVPVGGRKNKDARSEGLVYRGARRLERDGDPDSFFAKSFIRHSGMPRLDELDEVTGGLLWFRPLFATQTSIVHQEWKLGDGLEDVSASWDAWNRERPDTTVHAWNEPGAGMPRIRDHALLPRCVSFELEFERPIDRQRRTRTTTRVELGDVAFDVDDGERLPDVGGHLKVDGEWMLLRSVHGRRITVKRGVRGTKAMVHDPETMIHWGLPLTGQVTVAMYREDWNL